MASIMRSQINAELPGTSGSEGSRPVIFIRESVEDVQVTLSLGGLLTVLIVFLFLNSWRSTVITDWPCRSQ
jgi:HAE1 family hydrophobic/amphiphilic exporter-1